MCAQRSEHKAGHVINISWGRMTADVKRVKSKDLNVSWYQTVSVMGFQADEAGKIVDEIILDSAFSHNVSKFCRIYFQNTARISTPATRAPAPTTCILPALLQ